MPESTSDQHGRIVGRDSELAAVEGFVDSERFGLTLPRHVLRRVFEATLGNALFVRGGPDHPTRTAIKAC